MSEEQAWPDQLLSSFEVIRSSQYQQGRPYQQTHLTKVDRLPSSAVGPLRLKDFRNWNGHWYAESHVEEWVSHCPEALFRSQAVQVIGSQNYAHLPEKIDLLFLDAKQQFHIVEVKAERVASNRGLAPDRIWAQMNRYVDFIRNEVLPYPATHEKYYVQFAAQFLGSCHDMLDHVRSSFTKTFPIGSAAIVRTFITEGYDDDAVSYFRNRQNDEPTRLIYYRFYRCTGEIERHCIEFWEVPLVANHVDVPSCKQTE